MEIGTNNLVGRSPEVVGSDIEDLVRLLVGSYSVRVGTNLGTNNLIILALII